MNATSQAFTIFRLAYAHLAQCGVQGNTAGTFHFTPRHCRTSSPHFFRANTAWMPVGSDLCGYPVTIGASPMSGPIEANVSSTQAESACRQSTRHSQGWRKLLSAHINQQWGIIFDFGFAHAPGHLARRDAL